MRNLLLNFDMDGFYEKNSRFDRFKSLDGKVSYLFRLYSLVIAAIDDSKTGQIHPYDVRGEEGQFNLDLDSSKLQGWEDNLDSSDL